VQAAGAIAAITGAVWLFQAEAKTRRRERRREREVNAWGVRYAIQQAQFEMWEICDTLPSDESELDSDQPRQWRIQTVCAKSILQNYVNRTDHIHPDLIRLAMNGVMLIEEMEHHLTNLSQAVADGSTPESASLERIHAFKAHFQQLLVTFDERMRGVKLALDAGDDELPVSDFAEWQVPRE
jgi:hypothetical protein